MPWEARRRDRAHQSIEESASLQARDAAAAFRGLQAAHLFLHSPTFELYSHAHDRLVARVNKLQGARGVRAAELLTDEALAEVHLDLHALLGVSNVLIAGELKRWPQRCPKGHMYAKRFEDVLEGERTTNPPFVVFSALRHYSQHYAEIPIVMQQVDRDPFTAIGLHLNLPLDVSFWTPEQRAVLRHPEHGFHLLETLTLAYRSYATIDTANREMLLEVFVHELEAIERILEPLGLEKDEEVTLVETDAEGVVLRSAPMLTPHGVDALASLAALPALYPVMFECRRGPRTWIQGDRVPTRRPLLPSARWVPAPGEVPNWPLAVPGSLRELE